MNDRAYLVNADGTLTPTDPHNPDPRAFVTRGDLWTAAEAEEYLSLAKGLVKKWVQRGYIKPALTSRPMMFWSDDLYDCQLSSKLQREDRERGKFKRRVAS